MAPVTFVPPLEPLSSRSISPRFLSEDERVHIADLASRGIGVRAIAVEMNRSPSTISRELRRNLHVSGQYRPFHAHSQAARRRRRRRPRSSKLDRNPALHRFVRSKLSEKWSPQQISRAWRITHPDEPVMRLATESIYQAIYRPSSGLLTKPEPAPLRTGRDHRRAHTRPVRSRRRFAQPMRSVHDRGFDPTDRSAAGHWEGDLVRHEALLNRAVMKGHRLLFVAADS